MRSRWIVLLIVCALLGAGALVWRYSPLSAVAEPAQLAEWFESFEQSRWGPMAVIGLYIVGGFVLFPLSLLVAATAIVFEPLLAIGVAYAGSLLSGASTYAIGARFMRGGLRTLFGPAVDRVSGVLSNRGVLAMAAIRLVPIAPYSVVNVAAGSLGVRLWEFLAGTALGLAPGIIALSVFGQQIRSFWQQPTLGKVVLTAALVVAWIALSLALQRLVSRKRS